MEPKQESKVIHKIKTISYKELQEKELQYKLDYYQKLLAANNIVEYDPEESYPDFDLACEKFRNVCQQISTLLGESFNGSYDDIEKYKDDPRTESAEFKKLKEDLELYNNLCIHEGNKIGLPPPYWFFRCWNINH